MLRAKGPFLLSVLYRIIPVVPLLNFVISWATFLFLSFLNTLMRIFVSPLSDFWFILLYNRSIGELSDFVISIYSPFKYFPLETFAKK